MKRLLLLSGKGGTGKTTVAAAFIQFSNAKAFGDCDVDAPNLHLVSKVSGKAEQKAFYGGKKAFIDQALCTRCGLCMENCRFSAVLDQGDRFKVDEIRCEGCGLCEYICPQKAVRLCKDVAGTQELYRSPAVFSTARLKMGRGNSGKLVTDVKKDLFKNAPQCELAIIDGSPGIGCPVIASLNGMDLALIVAEPSESGLSDLKRLVKSAAGLRTGLAVCVNKWDICPDKTEQIIHFCHSQEIPFVGKIPYDPAASRAANDGVSLAAYPCRARDAIYDIYQKTSELLGI